MLRPKEIRELLGDSKHANIMTMVMYLINTGGEERFASWYELNPEVHKQFKLAMDHYAWTKPGLSKITWLEEKKQFTSRVEVEQAQQDADKKVRDAELEELIKEQKDNELKEKLKKDKEDGSK